MGRREVYARVITPLRLPDGCLLQPGQSIEAREMAAIGEESMGRLLGDGAVELRNRPADGAGGLVASAVLAGTIARNRDELAALDRALAQALGTIAEGGSDGRDPTPSESGSNLPCLRSEEAMHGLARSVLALARAHRDLRQEFDALVASLSARGVPQRSSG